MVLVWHNCQGYLCKQCLHRHCLRSPGDWATEIATNLLDWATEIATNLLDWATEIATNLLDWATEIATNLLDWATEIATNLLDCERGRVNVIVVDVRDYFLPVTDPRHND